MQQRKQNSLASYLHCKIALELGRDEKGCLPSTKKKAVVDVDHYFYLVDVDHPAFFMVEVDNSAFFMEGWKRQVDIDQVEKGSVCVCVNH